MNKAKRARKKLRGPKSCSLCGDADHKLKHFVVLVDGKRELNQATCRACTAILLVLLTDPRNRRGGRP